MRRGKFLGAAPQNELSFDRLVEIIAIRDTDVLLLGNGLVTFTIPFELNGFKLTRTEASVKTVAASGIVNIMIRNATTGNDMLSTPITIDATEENSYTAATPSVVNAATNTVATGNKIAVDIDSAPADVKGLNIIFTFNK